MVVKSLLSCYRRLTSPNNSRVEENANSIIVTVSVGVVSLIPSANCSTEIMLKSADELLYRAKRNGRNRVEAIAL